MAAKTIETRILLLCLAALLVTEVLASTVCSEARCYPMPLLGLIRAAEIVLLVLIVSVWGGGLSSIGLARNLLFPGLWKGLIWSAAFGMGALLGFAFLYVVRLDPLGLIKTHLPSDGREMVWFFLVGGLVGPIAEEIFFRGIIYGFLRRWGMLVALLGSTVIFVLPHFSQSGIFLTQMVGGVVFAVAYEVTGNLMVPITIHVLGNTAIFVLSFPISSFFSLLKPLLCSFQ